MTVFVALIGGSEVKVTVVAFNCRRIATLFNGVFNQARRGNDIFLVVDIDVADSKHVGNQHHLIVGHTFGDIVMALDNSQDQIAIGYTNLPEIMYGFGLGAQWKNWDINAFFQGSAHTSFFLDGVSVKSPFYLTAVVG